MEAKCADLLVLSLGRQRVNIRTATGTLTATMLEAFAILECDLMSERQQHRIANATTESWRTTQDIAARLLDTGEMSAT